MSINEYLRYFAVCQNTGAFGVGMCPGIAYFHLLGLPGLGDVLYFASTFSGVPVRNNRGGWMIDGSFEVQRLGGINHLNNYDAGAIV